MTTTSFTIGLKVTADGRDGVITGFTSETYDHKIFGWVIVEFADTKRRRLFRANEVTPA